MWVGEFLFRVLNSESGFSISHQSSACIYWLTSVLQFHQEIVILNYSCIAFAGIFLKNVR